MIFKKWTSIEKFSDAIVMAQRQFRKNIIYRAKVKLHGTNAGIHITPDGVVKFKKRTNWIDIINDNAGFAAWASTKDWSKLPKKETEYTIWGEWAGPGIHNSDAIGKTDKKRFFIFAIEVFNTNGGNETDSYIIDEPEVIRDIVKYVVAGDDDIRILPWADEPKLVRFFGDNASDGSITAREYAEYLNTLVDKMETRDDYVFENFGVDAPGEGYVIYPFEPNDDELNVDRGLFGAYTFKVKTESHTNSKTKGAKVAVVVPTSHIDFVDTHVTDARCEQMISEHCNGEYSMRNTPVFLKVLVADIEKETVNEREAGGITIKDVSKMISAKGVDWLKKKCNNL